MAVKWITGDLATINFIPYETICCVIICMVRVAVWDYLKLVNLVMTMLLVLVDVIMCRYRKFSLKFRPPLFIRHPYSNSEIISPNKKIGTFAIFAMDADRDENVRVV